VEYGEYSVKVRAYVWAIGPIEAFNLKTDLYKILLDRFRKENIEVPYPYRAVVMRENQWQKTTSSSPES
jgi:small-conductance mechanosensitive channel